MHVTLPIGTSTLMGSDVPENHPGQLVIGNNFSVSVVPENRDRCDELFAALSDGGVITMPLQETFWGAYFGSLTDRFGIGWMFNIELS